MVKTSQPIHYALLLPICFLLSHYEGGHLPYVSYILYAVNSASHSAHSSQHAKARGELCKTPLSVWHSELMSEQRADSTLKMMFQSVLPADEVKNHAQGYLIQNKVLLRKWVRHSDGYVGHPVNQIAVPSDAIRSCTSLMMSQGTWVLVKCAILFGG